MVKKTICALALATAGLLNPQNLDDEYIRPIPPKRAYEVVEIIGKEIKKAMELVEEKRWEKDKIWGIINEAYKEINVPEYISKRFVRSLIRVESEDFPRAVSYCGARGLGQIMKGTWYSLEKENFEANAFIPEKNIRVAVKCLVWMSDFCSKNHPNWDNLSDNEKINLVSACYNGGPYGLQRVNWDINKMYEETRNYVPKINKMLKEISPAD